jgi:prepilin-type N-terminal cleavage/methylation domain-containing protein
MVVGPYLAVRRRARRAARGFTVLELVLVIALIAMMAAALVLNIESMMRQSEASAVEGAFWEAARTARTDALLKRRTETVRYDEKQAAFVIESAGETRRFEIDRSQWKQELKLEIAFKKRLASSQFTLVGGQLVDLREIPSIQFFQDGTCTPFVLELVVGDTTRRIEVDPWTGAELLPDEHAS